MITDLAGRHAVVVGGTSGIGLACVRLAAEAGARVWAAGRSAERREAAAEALADRADRIEWHAADVQDPASLTRLFAAAAPVDILILAATGTDRAMGPFMEMELEGFRRSFGKLWGYTNGIQTGIPHMAPEGAIVMIGGAVARKCPPGMIAVSSVGNAVEGFCRALAPEIAPRRVNVVAPGLIETGMFDALPQPQRQAMFEAAAGNITLGRIGQPEEVASMVLAVATNGYMTGTTVDVEGGALVP